MENERWDRLGLPGLVGLPMDSMKRDVVYEVMAAAGVLTSPSNEWPTTDTIARDLADRLGFWVDTFVVVLGASLLGIPVGEDSGNFVFPVAVALRPA